jgi:hypothetical protein
MMEIGAWSMAGANLGHLSAASFHRATQPLELLGRTV